MPTPPEPVAGTAAVPLDAVPGDAVAAGPEALPEAAVKLGTSTAGQLCIAADNVPNPVLYCGQFFNIPANRVVVVSSWGGMMNEIFRYSRIDTLVVLTHGGNSPGEINLGEAQRTLGQWARGASSEDSGDPFAGLATFPGSIGTLHLEGCKVGADPAALLSFKQQVPVTSVESWSMGRYLDLYSITVSGSAEAVVQQYRASGDFTRASPYLPKGPLGGVYQASELESLLLNGSRFAIFAEVFGASLPFGTQRFGDLVAMPNPPFVPGTHLTRAEGLRNAVTVRTLQDASTLKAQIDSSRPILHRVIAR
ncbi:MAG TPA: hypothetical protein VFY87_18295 [Geminicoccaceae bacterium]|nr:hypothetical protein [Geminicoccaceae bacterium]